MESVGQISFGGRDAQHQTDSNRIQSEQDTATLGINQDIRMQPKFEDRNSSLFVFNPEQLKQGMIPLTGLQLPEINNQSSLL